MNPTHAPAPSRRVPATVARALPALALAFAFGAGPRALAAFGRTAVLENAKLRATISETGGIESVQNLLASETCAFDADFFVVDTDSGEFSNRTARPASVRADGRQAVFHYEFGPAEKPGTAVGVDLVYRLEPENAFLRRHLIITNAAPLRLKNIILGRTVFASPAVETVHYVTFIAAPTVEFVRHEKGGLFSGIENPFFKTELNNSGMSLGFEPGLILKAGEGYASEPQFLGVYKKSGVMIEDSGRAFRYNANGSGYKPIDRNEMRAMRAFALDYLRPAQKKFLNINYQFFHPLPIMPRTEKHKDYFINAIDTFAKIGGDMIIFRPLHPYTKPDAGRPYWDVLPEDGSQVSRQIAGYASGKGLSYGFYMGCAAHGKEGNAGGLAFRPDKPEWKKTDAAGRRAPDNCLACDDYYEWWFAVQNNTIRKYRLGNWSWDPSIGSGMNCHDESHGHAAGKGAYKGWRRCIELMGRLKTANPGLFIQGFYGTKNFGLWGLRHVDQSEVYNEQTIIVSTRHNQISDDRQNADGLRFQNNWSMRFRFTPAVIGHALAHRISEGRFDPELAKAWDYYGWEYAVMSDLAVAGSVMPTILPYQTDLVPGYVEFYRKWLGWAKENFESVNHTEPFGEQVQPGAVDGYARIKGGHGFVFLFNGNPRASEITFEVGDEINLQAGGDYEFVELYPSEKGRRVVDNDGRSIFALGQSARITVPANSCHLFELRKARPQAGPLLLGVDGVATLRGDALEIAGVAGKPGRRIPARVRLARPGAVRRVTVNGVPQDFSIAGQDVCLEIGFAGERYERELDAWTHAAGRPFVFPNSESLKDVRLATTFRLNRQLPQLLERARPKNHAGMAGRIAGWQKRDDKGRPLKRDYSYHNFIGSRPDRLWLVLPFLARTDAEVTLNGRRVASLMRNDPSNSIFADVTDLAGYGTENRLEIFCKALAPDSFILNSAVEKRA